MASHSVSVTAVIIVVVIVLRSRSVWSFKSLPRGCNGRRLLRDGDRT